MKITEFAYVAYPVTDMARARAFYEGVLSLTRTPRPNDAESPWFEYEVGPHTLGIGNYPHMKPSSDGACLALEVEDFDRAVTHLKNHQVPFQVEPYQGPVCRLAIVLDPDGNWLIIHQRNA